MEAHQQLEELILDRDTYAEKNEMGSQLAQIVYEGKWFTPLREASPGIRRKDSGICDRRSKVQALQGQYHQGRHNLSVLPLQ